MDFHKLGKPSETLAAPSACLRLFRGEDLQRDPFRAGSPGSESSSVVR